MNDHRQRSALLHRKLNERILFLDGAMGAMIQRYKLGEQDYRGERFADWAQDVKGNNDLLSLTQPQIIQAIHDAYLDAGADILETNTFNSPPVSPWPITAWKSHGSPYAAQRSAGSQRRRLPKSPFTDC